MPDLSTVTPVVLLSFGAVYAATKIKKDLTSEQKLGLAIIAAFLVGYIPTDLGSELANRIKDAVYYGGAGTSVLAGVLNKLSSK